MCYEDQCMRSQANGIGTIDILDYFIPSFNIVYGIGHFEFHITLDFLWF
jgi:hypothetical protein